MRIGEAVAALIDGKKVRRSGWNGKNMFLVYVPGQNVKLKEGTPYAKAMPDVGGIQIDAHVDMLTAGGSMQPGWLCSQADLLATDWELV